jgi:hypothetical protein
MNKGDVAAQGPCYVCQKMLWLSFFFDAPKHDAIEEEMNPTKMTNVGKLFSLHTKTSEARGVYRIYFNGLQKPLNGQDGAKKATQQELGDKTLTKDVEEKIKDAGNEALRSSAKARKIKLDSVKTLIDPKTWKSTLIKIVSTVGLETIDSVRDNPVVSGITGSGATTRINNAIRQFDNIIKSQTESITRVKIAIFGADFGAAMARAFANKLINERLTIKGAKLFHGQIEVEFVLMGLFDCVSARSKNILNSLALDRISLGFYSQGLSEPMGIRPHFQTVFHAVAAHENRLYKRIDSVRRCKGPRVKEELFSGEQQDVIGGHAPGEQSRSDQLSRIPLKRMYSEALHCGVPLRELEIAEDFDIDLVRSFALTDQLIENGIPQDTASRSRSVMNPPLKAGSLEEGLAAGARQRLRWLASAYAVPEKHEKYAAQFERLAKQIQGIQNAFNDPISRNPWGPQSEASKALQKLLSRELNLLKTWEQEFKKFNGEFPQRPLPEDVTNAAMFEQFIHDAFAEADADQLDRMEATLTEGPAYWGYLTVRPIDDSDTFTDD